MKITTTLVALTLLVSGMDAPDNFSDLGDDADRSGDLDDDGVPDLDDLCPGSDDTVDLNGNDVPDCSETWANDLMFDDAQSVNAMIHVPPTDVGWTSTSNVHDGNGYSESGALVVFSVSPGVPSQVSVCIDIPLAYDYLGVWYHAVGTSSVPTVLNYHQYTGKHCTGAVSTTTSYPGDIYASSATPWHVVHDPDEVHLGGSTMSVMIDFGVLSDDPWVIDNVLLLPRMATANDEPPADDE
jgi:hypothetical protein